MGKGRLKCLLDFYTWETGVDKEKWNEIKKKIICDDF